jgi:hypothetical protein
MSRPWESQKVDAVRPAAGERGPGVQMQDRLTGAPHGSQRVQVRACQRLGDHQAHVATVLAMSAGRQARQAIRPERLVPLCHQRASNQRHQHTDRR